MALLLQYDIFEQECITELKAELASEKESKRKMQKKLFAMHNDMVKMLFELLHRIEQLEGKRNE